MVVCSAATPVWYIDVAKQRLFHTVKLTIGSVTA
jgi:hypothetical protein